MSWPNFDTEMWKTVLRDTEGIHLSSLPKIIASDRDAGAIRAAQANAERAGVADCIDFTCRSFSAIEPPPSPGWVVTNPPYGVRVSTHRDLRNLYAQIGNVLRAKCPGWNIAMLCNSTYLLRNTGLTFDEDRPLINGGLKVRFVMGKVT
jgi:putative N6-adenine-specific DNA methylase